MLRILTTSSCTWAAGNKKLALAALELGETYKIDLCLKSNEETDKAQKLGINLPCLVREDGAMSRDGKKWFGGKRNYKNVKRLQSGISAERENVNDEPSGYDNNRDEEVSTVC